jgi:hypothetical protein
VVPLMTACADPEEPTFATQPPLGTAPAVTVPRATTSTSTTTTPAAITEPTTTVAAVPTRLTPADLGPLVDPSSIPDVPGMPVPGEVVEIYPLVWMYLPSVFDDTDRNVIPPTAADIEILTGYGRAIAAEYEQVTQNPVPAEPIPSVQATHADGGAAVRAESYETRSAEGTSVGFRDGKPDIFRPQVLVSPRSETEALVFNCGIYSSTIVDAAGNPTTESPDGPYAAPYGSSTNMVKIDGVWLIETRRVAQAGACA